MQVQAMNKVAAIIMYNQSIFSTFIEKICQKIEILCWHPISDF